MAGRVLKVGFAVYPSVKMFTLNAEKKLVFAKELLFGDYIKPLLDDDGAYKIHTVVKKDKKGNVKTNKDGTVQKEEFIRVHCRGIDGYIHESDMQSKRPLEVNFVDVGQGDGCHIVTPDDQHFIIDAGESDNMFRYLKWRFNIRTAKTAPPEFTAVISHPDSDHYSGFGKLFTKAKKVSQQFRFNKIYHNGMVEAASDLNYLGTLKNANGRNYVTDLCDDEEAYEKRVAGVKAGEVYPGKTSIGDFMKVLEKTSAEKESLRFGSGSIYDNKKYDMKLEVMAPVAEMVDGKPALRVFDSKVGPTKNGHSIVLKLTIGHLRILLGGDLNTLSEYWLIEHYSGYDIAAIKEKLASGGLTDKEREKLEADLKDAILLAREKLEVDIAKSCHHGSADFSSEFLQVLNPIATVISSGDEEPHCHPRPDTLGTIGKYSRGERSLIFSTELARSGKEFLEMNTKTEKKEEKKENADAKNKKEKKQTLSAQKKRERVVTVYGMINVRTDGEKVVIAQKLEAKASGRSWDKHMLVWKEDKQAFEYVKDKVAD